MNQYNLKDHAQPRPRERSRSEGVTPLARRIRRYGPAVITVVMKAIEGDVAAAAEKTGSAGVQTPALPFPNWPTATEDYKSQLASLVARWVEAGVVAAPRD